MRSCGQSGVTCFYRLHIHTGRVARSVGGGLSFELGWYVHQNFDLPPAFPLKRCAPSGLIFAVG